MIHRCATGGGHRGLRFFLIAQSLGRITIDARRAAQRLVLFPQPGEDDMREVARKIGPTKEAQLRRMKQKDFPVLWQQGQLEGVEQ